MLKEQGWPNLIAEYKVKRGLANHDYFKKNAFSNEMQLESSLARQSMADKSAFFQAIKSFYQLDNSYIAQQHRLWSDTSIVRSPTTSLHSSMTFRPCPSSAYLRRPSGTFRVLLTS